MRTAKLNNKNKDSVSKTNFAALLTLQGRVYFSGCNHDRMFNFKPVRNSH